MGEITGIEWCDHTFNPWIGCTKVSAACDHCYAEAMMDTRWGRVKWGPGEKRIRTSGANWHEPLKWDRKAKADGVRRKVFCASLADVFDAEVADAWRIELMDLIRATPNLDWLLLTKRPQVAWKFFRDHGPVPDNVWMGATVESNAMAAVRMAPLLGIKARRHFLSCEPLQERLKLDPIWLAELDWIICGGESGPGARSMNPSWARSLRDDCQRAGIWFFFKQWGDWMPDGPTDHAHTRVGKARAGSLLDGREWKERPA